MTHFKILAVLMVVAIAAVAFSLVMLLRGLRRSARSDSA